MDRRMKLYHSGVERKLETKAVTTRTKFHLTACDSMTALTFKEYVGEIPDDAEIDEFYEEKIDDSKFLVIVFHHEKTEQE